MPSKKYNLFLLTSITLTGLITWPATQYLLYEWMQLDETLSQGFACLALILFFYWQLTFVKEDFRSPPSKLWWLLLLGSSCGWCLAQLGNLQLPAYLATLGMILFLFASCINFAAFKKLIPVFGLFIFAIPVWSGQLLVELSSLVVGYVLQFMNLTLQIQDNQILTPWGTIVIADGCSGLGYLIVSLLLTYLLWLLNAYPIKTFIAVFAVAIMLGLLTNWIRITLLVLIAYHTEMTHSLVRNHELFGWILFAVIALPALYFAPQKKSLRSSIPLSFHFNKWIFLCWVAGPLIYFFVPFTPVAKNPIQLDKDNFYQKDPTAIPGIFLRYPPADQIFNTGVSLQETPIHLEVMLHTAKNKNEKVVPYMGQLYDQNRWRQIRVEKTSNGHIELLEQRNTQQKILLAYQFQVGPWKTPDYTQAKLLQIPAKLTDQGYFGFWSAQAVCKSDCKTELQAINTLTANW
jgi:exosortase